MYNPSIPQANDIISSSQPQILTNFTQLNTLFGIDHIGYDNATAANRGKHNKITFIQQAADPAPPAGEIALYTKNVGGTPRLFIQEQAPGSAIYQFSGPTPSNANPGHTWLPGGLLMKFGNFTTVNSTLQTLTYPAGAGIPAFSAAPYSVQACIESAAGAARVFVNVRAGTNAIASVQFNTVDQNNNSIGLRVLYWIAIGPA